MKVVSIAILRTGPDVAEPIPVSMACELSSYGFFQRQVRTYIIATEFRGRLAFFCSRGILMANHGCVYVGTEGCGGRQVKIAGKHAASCFARLGLASMVSCGAGRISPGFCCSANFWLSVRALSDLLGRSVREDSPA